MWGILRSIEPVGGGLIRATLGIQQTLVPEELSTEMEGMIGEAVVVVRVEEEYGCGRLPL
jgi:hypothetical protein